MNASRVLLIGANGQLGSDLAKALARDGAEVIPRRHSDIDVRDGDAVARELAAHRSDFVINTAAFHKVEECETHPELAFEVNATAVRRLGVACAEAGAVLVHFSTDYVFGSGKQEPYAESDLPGPLNVYGASKLAGEYLLATVADRYYIIRTCGLYGVAGSSGKGGNFVELMLRKAQAGETIRVVNDQVLTPTYTVDLAEAVVALMKTGRFGLYHVSAESKCSWYEFARGIFEISGMHVDLRPATTAGFPSPVRRPSYSVLSKAKLRALGIEMPDWRDGLPRYLADRNARVVTVG
jgi:dTDP-4-dehydrorhamnose reductase